MEVQESWDRIVAWLNRNAPPVAALINAPATEGLLTQVEAEVGLALPADLAAWWRRADGMDWVSPFPGCLIPPYFRPHSVAYALRSRRIWLDVMYVSGEESELLPEPAGTPCDIWLPTWVPIASNTGNVELFVDLRGGSAHGCVMEYDNVFGAATPPLWPGVAAMLADIANALEHKQATQGYLVHLDHIGNIEWIPYLNR